MINQIQDNLIEHDISLNDTIVFIHVPKAGGITLGTLIDPMWQPGARCPEYMTLPLARLPRAQIAQYRSFIGHFNYSALAQLLPPGFQSISMLREPLSRHISFLRMVKRLGEAAEDGSILPAMVQIGNPFFLQMVQIANRQGGQEIFKAWREKPLEALIEDEELQKNQGMVNGQTRQLTPIRLLGGRIPDQPGCSEKEIDAVLLETACKNLASMLGFGLLERFQESIHMLSYLFGWRPIPDSLRLNEAPQRLAADRLPASALARLAGYNELDVKLYDYARALFEQRFNQMTMTLLERYGDKEHAQLKPPLPADVLEALLEKHYRLRFLQRNPTGREGSTSSTFSFDQAVSGGFGWQRLETSPTCSPFRWTGPGTEASIDLVPLSGGDLQLQIGICDAVKPELLDEITITVNDESLPCQRLSTAGNTVIQSAIPLALIHRTPYLRLGIHVAETLAPHTLDAGNPDSRQLGVAVNWIKQIIMPV
jgi:hypothetical protein